jgi:hypothetical protein
LEYFRGNVRIANTRITFAVAHPTSGEPEMLSSKNETEREIDRDYRMPLNECELQIRAKSLRDRWATNAQILRQHATSDSELNVTESLAMMWEATAMSWS